MPTSNANATWEGKLQEGKGHYEGESGAINGDYTVATRFGGAKGTNPEELLAAAEAACFSMALSLGVEKAGGTPERVHTDAACTVEKVGEGFSITRIRLRVRARVSGMDRETFRGVAEQTKQNCPVSRALKGVDIQLEEVTLE